MLLVFNQFQAMISFYSCWKQQKTKGLSASVLIPKIKSFQPSNNCSSYYQSKILWQPCCTEHIKYNTPQWAEHITTKCFHAVHIYLEILRKYHEMVLFREQWHVFWNFNLARKLKCHVAIMLTIMICIA